MATQLIQAAQQSTLCLQAVCRYISDVLAGDASSSEKRIARTIMHLLPLEQAAPIQQAEAQQPATGEPVAWRYQPEDGLKFPGFTQYEAVAVSRGKPGTVVPLYTHPAPGVSDNTACKSVQKRLEAQQPTTPEPVGAREALERIASWSEHPAMLAVDYGSNGVRDYYRKIARDALTHPAPGVPEFSRIAKRKLDELQEHGFAITGYAIQRGPVRGFIDGWGFVGWWQGEPDPGVPDDVVRLVRFMEAAFVPMTPQQDEIAKALALASTALAASPAQKGGE